MERRRSGSQSRVIYNYDHQDGVGRPVRRKSNEHHHPRRDFQTGFEPSSKRSSPSRQHDNFRGRDSFHRNDQYKSGRNPSPDYGSNPTNHRNPTPEYRSHHSNYRNPSPEPRTPLANYRNPSPDDQTFRMQPKQRQYVQVARRPPPPPDISGVKGRDGRDERREREERRRSERRDDPRNERKGDRRHDRHSSPGPHIPKRARLDEQNRPCSPRDDAPPPPAVNRPEGSVEALKNFAVPRPSCPLSPTIAVDSPNSSISPEVIHVPSSPDSEADISILEEVEFSSKSETRGKDKIEVVVVDVENTDCDLVPAASVPNSNKITKRQGSSDSGESNAPTVIYTRMNVQSRSAEAHVETGTELMKKDAKLKELAKEAVKNALNGSSDSRKYSKTQGNCNEERERKQSSDSSESNRTRSENEPRKRAKTELQHDEILKPTTTENVAGGNGNSNVIMINETPLRRSTTDNKNTNAIIPAVPRSRNVSEKSVSTENRKAKPNTALMKTTIPPQAQVNSQTQPSSQKGVAKTISSVSQVENAVKLSVNKGDMNQKVESDSKSKQTSVAVSAQTKKNQAAASDNTQMACTTKLTQNLKPENRSSEITQKVNERISGECKKGLTLKEKLNQKIFVSASSTPLQSRDGRSDLLKPFKPQKPYYPSGQEVLKDLLGENLSEEDESPEDRNKVNPPENTTKPVDMCSSIESRECNQETRSLTENRGTESPSREGQVNKDRGNTSTPKTDLKKDATSAKIGLNESTATFESAAPINSEERQIQGALSTAEVEKTVGDSGTPVCSRKDLDENNAVGSKFIQDSNQVDLDTGSQENTSTVIVIPENLSNESSSCGSCALEMDVSNPKEVPELMDSLPEKISLLKPERLGMKVYLDLGPTKITKTLDSESLLKKNTAARETGLSITCAEKASSSNSVEAAESGPNIVQSQDGSSDDAHGINEFNRTIETINASSAKISPSSKEALLPGDTTSSENVANPLTVADEVTFVLAEKDVVEKLQLQDGVDTLNMSIDDTATSETSSSNIEFEYPVAEKINAISAPSGSLSLENPSSGNENTNCEQVTVPLSAGSAVSSKSVEEEKNCPGDEQTQDVNDRFSAVKTKPVKDTLTQESADNQHSTSKRTENESQQNQENVDSYPVLQIVEKPVTVSEPVCKSGTEGTEDEDLTDRLKIRTDLFQAPSPTNHCSDEIESRDCNAVKAQVIPELELLKAEFLNSFSQHLLKIRDSVAVWSSSATESYDNFQDKLNNVLKITEEQYCIVDKMKSRSFLVNQSLNSSGTPREDAVPSKLDPMKVMTVDSMTEYFQALLLIDEAPSLQRVSCMDSLNFLRHRICRILHFYCKHRAGRQEASAINAVDLLYKKFYESFPTKSPKWSYDQIVHCWDSVRLFPGELDERAIKLDHEKIGSVGFLKKVKVLISALMATAKQGQSAMQTVRIQSAEPISSSSVTRSQAENVRSATPSIQINSVATNLAGRPDESQMRSSPSVQGVHTGRGTFIANQCIAQSPQSNSNEQRMPPPAQPVSQQQQNNYNNSGVQIQNTTAVNMHGSKPLVNQQLRSPLMQSSSRIQKVGQFGLASQVVNHRDILAIKNQRAQQLSGGQQWPTSLGSAVRQTAHNPPILARRLPAQMQQQFSTRPQAHCARHIAQPQQNPQWLHSHGLYQETPIRQQITQQPNFRNSQASMSNTASVTPLPTSWASQSQMSVQMIPRSNSGMNMFSTAVGIENCNSSSSSSNNQMINVSYAAGNQTVTFDVPMPSPLQSSNQLSAAPGTQTSGSNMFSSFPSMNQMNQRIGDSGVPTSSVNIRTGEYSGPTVFTNDSNIGYTNIEQQADDSYLTEENGGLLLHRLLNE